MQEVRAIVAEKSTMSIHLRGESVEVPHHFIGLLLEGYIRGQGIQEELIASPSALLPLYGDTSFQGTDISGVRSHQMCGETINLVLLHGYRHISASIYIFLK